MKKINLYINNQQVDFDDNQSSATYQLTIENVLNPLKIKNESSISIKLPKTSTNNKIFEHISRPDRVITSDNINTSKKLLFKMTIDGETFRKGYCKINKVTTTEYDISLYGEIGDVFNELSKIKLKDLTFPTDLSHTINRDFIYENWIKAKNKNYSTNDIHDIIRYIPSFQGLYSDFNSSNYVTDTAIESLDFNEDEYTANEFRSYFQKPAIKVSYLLQAIVDNLKTNTDYSINSTFFTDNNPYFSNTFFTLKKYQEIEKTGDFYRSQLLLIDNTNFINNPLYVGVSDSAISSDNKYNFTPFIGYTATSVLTFAFKLRMNINKRVDFSCVLRPNEIYNRNLTLNFTEDQGVVTGGVSVLLDELANSNDYIIYAEKNNSYASLLKRIDESQRSYVLSSEYKNEYGTVTEWFGVLYGDIIEFTQEGKVIITANTTKSGSFQVTYNSDNKDDSKDRVYRLYAHRDSNIIIDGCNLVNFQFTALTGYSAMTLESGIASNSTVTPLSLFEADMTAKDFLIEYCRLYGLYFTVDNNVLNIVTRNNFYANYNKIKIDEYFDESSDFSITPTVLEDATLLMSYKSGGKSEYLNRYRDKYAVEYGAQKIDTGYEFNTNTKNVLDTTFFYPVAMVEQFVINNSQSLTLPCYFEYNGNDRKAVDLNANLLFFDDNVKLSDNKTYYITDDTDLMLSEDNICWNRSSKNKRAVFNNNEIPRYSTYINNYSLDIARPNSLWSGQSEYSYNKDFTIFNRFHKNWFEDRYNVNTKRFTGYFVLPLHVINSIQFNNFVIFRGVLWTFESIDIDLTNLDNKCKVSLISVNNIDNYVNGQNNDIPFISTINEISVDADTTELSIPIISNCGWQVDGITPIYGGGSIATTEQGGSGNGWLNVILDKNTTNRYKSYSVQVGGQYNITVSPALTVIRHLPKDTFFVDFLTNFTETDYTNKFITIPFKTNIPIKDLTVSCSGANVISFDDKNVVIYVAQNNTNRNQTIEVILMSNNSVEEFSYSFQQTYLQYNFNIISPLTDVLPFSVTQTQFKYDSNATELYINTDKGYISDEYNKQFILNTEYNKGNREIVYNLSVTGQVQKSIKLTQEANPDYIRVRNADVYSYETYEFATKFTEVGQSTTFNIETNFSELYLEDNPFFKLNYTYFNNRYQCTITYIDGLLEDSWVDVKLYCSPDRWLILRLWVNIKLTVTGFNSNVNISRDILTEDNSATDSVQKILFSSFGGQIDCSEFLNKSDDLICYTTDIDGNIKEYTDSKGMLNLNFNENTYVTFKFKDSWSEDKKDYFSQTNLPIKPFILDHYGNNVYKTSFNVIAKNECLLTAKFSDTDISLTNNILFDTYSNKYYKSSATIADYDVRTMLRANRLSVRGLPDGVMITYMAVNSGGVQVAPISIRYNGECIFNMKDTPEYYDTYFCTPFGRVMPDSRQRLTFKWGLLSSTPPKGVIPKFSNNTYNLSFTDTLYKNTGEQSLMNIRFFESGYRDGNIIEWTDANGNFRYSDTRVDGVTPFNIYINGKTGDKIIVRIKNNGGNSLAQGEWILG